MNRAVRVDGGLRLNPPVGDANVLDAWRFRASRRDRSERSEEDEGEQSGHIRYSAIMDRVLSPASHLWR
jgi:hypothetical protein